MKFNLSINEVEFHLVSWGSPKKKTTENNFVLVKDPSLAQSMARICTPLNPKNIIEFGVYHGASLVLLDKIYTPDSIIEDWGWSHWPGEFQKKEFFPGTPLSKLVFKLLMLQSVIPNVIAKIETDYNHVAITKGEKSNHNNEKLFELIKCKSSIHIEKHRQ